MQPSELDTTRLVEWIRDCIAVALQADSSGHEQLRLDAIEELRELFTEYQRRGWDRM